MSNNPKRDAKEEEEEEEDVDDEDDDDEEFEGTRCINCWNALRIAILCY